MSQNAPTIILASTSPYRRELLERIGIEFAQEAPETDETRVEGESAAEMVMRLAKAKAAAVAARHDSGLVIGSDQCAVRDHEVLGKPHTEENALQQLRAASGKRVRFLTAVCVIDAASGTTREHMDETVVSFRELDDASLKRYIAAEQPLDCAGSFKSEALGITLFERIENEDPSALMGLPLIATARLLREFGLQLP
ncbi:MAG: nucleoside triphosphate pyrophosphatase [Gammaproteobacteria bacterium]|nr:nucleoside triphosphate pyrophosphatase [Gammaproteobacteria bacterium]